MDAAARAELDALRRRAYSPGADIHDDPAALRRLVELEELARPGAAEPSAPGPAGTEAIPARKRRSGRVSSGGGDPRPKTRGASRTTLIVGAALVAVVVAVALAQRSFMDSTAAEPSPTMEDRFLYRGAPDATTLTTVRLDAAISEDVDTTIDDSSLAFPATAELSWAVPLGDYYGWHLWVAGGDGDQDDDACILVTLGTHTHARCVPAEDRQEGRLYIELATSDIATDAQPRPMDEDDRVRFLWAEDTVVEVMFGSFADG